MHVLSRLKTKFVNFTARLAYPVLSRSIEAEMESKWKTFGLESTNACNARCSFCVYRLNTDKRKKGSVNPKVLEHCLKLLSHTNDDFFSFISILGDPLADAKLLDNIKTIKTYDKIKHISIYSNLIGLDNFDLDDFVTSGITSLSISISLGGDQMYKRLFGVDCYEKVANGLLKLLDCNKKHGEPITIVVLGRMDYPIETNLDIALMDKLKQYLPSNRIDILPNEMWDDWNGAIAKEDLPLGGTFRSQINDKTIPCYALYRKIQVLKDGEISVCSCRLSPELVTGNIMDYSSLEKYWLSESLLNFRRKWFEGDIPSICRGCNHYHPYTVLIEKRVREKTVSFLKKLLLIS